MNEAEWLSSDDPAAMLTHLTREWDKGGTYCVVGDRKLRLFACAVARLNGHDATSISFVEDCVEAGQPNHNFSDQDAIDRGQFWRLCRSEQAARSAAHAYTGASSLLREIVGNPFRPVMLPMVCQRCGMVGGKTCETVNDGIVCAEGSAFAVAQCRGGIQCPWLTPTVLSLATAAHDERQADGTLDPLTLAAVADALEEAGCENETLLRHLRGWTMCLCEMQRLYGIELPVRNKGAGGQMITCFACDDGWRPLPGPHVRGCWVLDLVLGRN